MFRNLRAKITAPVLAVMGLVFVGLGIQELRIAAQLDKEGVVVPAQALDYQVHSGRRGSKSYKIVTEYTSREGGTVHSQEFKVPKLTFEQAQAGQPIEVRYLPSDPKVAEIVGGRKGGEVNIGIGAVMSLIGVVMCFFVFRR